MSYRVHMKGYEGPRTLYQTDSLYAWKHEQPFLPVLVEVNPTNSCNQQCRFCYTNKRVEPRESMRDEVLVDSFSQLADAGVRAVLLQGTGEPLMHKALPDAIENGARRGLAIGLCTSGILLDEAMQEKILKHLLYVRFSVLESDPQRYMYLHGCPQKQYDALIQNIRNAVALREKRGLSFGLCSTVYLYKDNFRRAHEIVQFYKDLGIDYIFIQEATYTGFSPAGKEQAASKCFSGAEISEMKQRVMALSDDDCRVKVKYPGDNETLLGKEGKGCWRKGFCQGIKFYSVISCDGGVYPCWRAWGQKEYCYGSLYEQRFAEIWAGQRRREIEEKILNTPPQGDECLNCNNPKLNAILRGLTEAGAGWKDFIL